MAQVEARVDGVLHVALGDPNTNVHVNSAMLRAGLSVLVARRNRVSTPNATLLDTLESDEKLAHVAHTGMWANGDIADDDEY
jgi:endonuclease YncB( thermonuclease family)